LFSDAGIGESGPVCEIPLDLVRKNYETNVFAPLALAQGFIRKFIDEKRAGKIVFTSSMGGLFSLRRPSASTFPPSMPWRRSRRRME
jgi:NAD(P)-dependent dehydrogenase (short-subunit alcohol dehydrogenase family)